MHWLALHCPTLPLDCILRRWPAGFEPALAVTDVHGTRRLIAAVTSTARVSGVAAGQSIATALSLMPQLVLIARKLEDERNALREAALAALRFTPVVSLRASGLVMEISASFKLFGGRRSLKKRIAAAMRVQGLATVAGEAPTPHGAWLIALEHARRRMQPQDDSRSRTSPSRVTEGRPEVSAPLEDFQARLDGLPVMHLESARASLRHLDGIGVRTCADLRRLPAQGLARRFGPALIDEFARATGDRPDPQIVFEAPSRFDARIELMARVDNSEVLVFAAQRLLAQMTGWLTARRAAVRAFTLMLHHDRWKRDAIAPTAVTIGLASPSNDLARLGALVRERLSRLELVAPVLELSLAAPILVEEREEHEVLFPECKQGSETLARLFEKLTARLGPEAMARLDRMPDHRPERAWRSVCEPLFEGRVATIRTHREADSAASSKLAGVQGRGIAMIDIERPHRTGGPRPTWLLSEPEPLEIRAHRPIFESLPVRLVAGPERIETGWWDDTPATRDYYIGENMAGRLVWIYRERLPMDDEPLWYLQGLFG